MAPNDIRTDLFSVKARFSLGDKPLWCHELITSNKTQAIAELTERRKYTQAKLVHPKQWVVDGYVAVGNTIN